MKKDTYGVSKKEIKPSNYKTRDTYKERPIGSGEVDLYSKAPVEDDDAYYSTKDLMPCANCGRKFNPESHKKHSKICKKVEKKRKPFNMVKQRLVDNDQIYLIKEGKKVDAILKQKKEKNKLKWLKQSLEFRAICKNNIGTFMDGNVSYGGSTSKGSINLSVKSNYGVNSAVKYGGSSGIASKSNYGVNSAVKYGGSSGIASKSNYGGNSAAKVETIGSKVSTVQPSGGVTRSKLASNSAAVNKGKVKSYENAELFAKPKVTAKTGNYVKKDSSNKDLGSVAYMKEKLNQAGLNMNNLQGSAVTDDYTLCKFCSRKYNETAYNKHLDFCQRKYKEAGMKARLMKR